MERRVQEYREVNNLPPDAKVPADAVTASGSGFDPHITIANAELQIPRVAEERDLSEVEVRELHLERLDPLVLVLTRVRFRWGGGWLRRGRSGTGEYVAHRFGIPVVILHREIPHAKAS